MANTMKDDRAQKRAVLVTALALGVLALAFFISAFLRSG